MPGVFSNYRKEWLRLDVGLLLIRIEGRMFFANAQQVAQKTRPLLEQFQPSVVVLDLSGVIDLEYSALKMLTESEKRARGTSVWLSGLNTKVLQMIRRSPLGSTLGSEALLFNLEMAVKKYLGPTAVAGALK